jgi:hypothetical protein
MHPQYVATQSSSTRFIDAAESQALASKTVSYLFNKFRASFPQGYTQVAYPQKTRGNRHSVGNLRVENRDRSLQCKRASRAFLPFPCLPSWRHVVAATMQVTLRNLWLLTQFQSPSSRFSLVSITKLTSGQAAAPVPTKTRFRTSLIGGFA